MTQWKNRVFPALLALLVVLGSGCAGRCVLVRSEYYDVTGRVFAPLDEARNISVYAEAPVRPHAQIGVVKVEAPLGTSEAAIDAEMVLRARQAGGEALVRLGSEENVDGQKIFCGKVFNTRKSVSARGAVIIYTDKEPDA